MSSQEKPRAARLYPRDSELQEAPLSKASHAHGFSSESKGRVFVLWLSVVGALARAVQRSARLCSLTPLV